MLNDDFPVVPRRVPFSIGVRRGLRELAKVGRNDLRELIEAARAGGEKKKALRATADLEAAERWLRNLDERFPKDADR